MNAPPDQQLLETIAIDLGVDPSFVEKDWHAMRLVAVLAGVEHSDLRPVFSGGTSLSEAYGLGARSCVATCFSARREPSFERAQHREDRMVRIGQRKA